MIGAPGTVTGVMLLDADEALPVPALLVAVTVNVYVAPLVKPVTVMGLDEPEPVKAPGLEVTVYPVIALPPLKAGAENVMEA
jgi:hypothetical protein